MSDGKGELKRDVPQGVQGKGRDGNSLYNTLSEPVEGMNFHLLLSFAFILELMHSTRGAWKGEGRGGVLTLFWGVSWSWQREEDADDGGGAQLQHKLIFKGHARIIRGGRKGGSGQGCRAARALD